VTYCLGIKLRQGLIGLADTRITSGNETTMAKKVFVINRNKHCLFIMTSGLRSIKDKVITYFNEVIEEQDADFNKLYKAVNAFADQVRRVKQEDNQSLKEAGFQFNFHALVGGQLEDDEEHKLYLLYPQGNWIEVGKATPYIIIGNTGYGKPILDRSVHFDSEFEYALKSAFISFDATRISANDVDFPIDIVVYNANSYQIIEHRFQREELMDLSEFWRIRIAEAVNEFPSEWMKGIIHKIPGSGPLIAGN
jgi:putative proteasome-type protease